MRESEAGNSVFEVRQMLHERANALSRGDLDRYLEPMTPEAKAVEQPIAEGTRAVPISDVRLVFRPSESVPARATSFSDVPTQFVYGYKGLPEANLFFFSLRYDVEKRDGSWIVTRSRIDESAPAPIWATGPVQVRDSDHFLSISRPGLARGDEAVQLAEQARADLIPKLQLEPDPKYLLLLARDHAEFNAIGGEDFEEGTLALASFDTRDGNLPSRYMLVNLQGVLENPDRVVKGHTGELTAKAVFQHELAHVALLRYTRPRSPGWVVEGAAMYLSGERRTREWAQMAHLGFLERDLSNALVAPREGPGGSLPGELYAYSNAAVLYLVETFGTERFWTFYRTFTRLDPAELRPDDPAGVSKLLDDIYDLDAERLDRAVRDYIKKQLSASPGAVPQ